MIHRLQLACQPLSGRSPFSTNQVLRCLYIAIGVVLCLHSAVRGECSDVDGFLHDFEKHRGNVETYSANFVQKRMMDIFGEERISTGVVLYKAPERMMWKYQTPDRTQMLVERESVSFYFPELEQIEIYALGKGEEASSFFFAFEAGADALKKTFEISLGADDEPLRRVELSPKPGADMSRLASLTLWIDKSDYLPREILIRDKTGDSTDIKLSDIKVNQPIADVEMNFNAPEGTTIVQGDSGTFSF
jgi:outer membrane lipoprotein carrier protein